MAQRHAEKVPAEDLTSLPLNTSTCQCTVLKRLPQQQLNLELCVGVEKLPQQQLNLELCVGVEKATSTTTKLRVVCGC